MKIKNALKNQKKQLTIMISIITALLFIGTSTTTAVETSISSAAEQAAAEERQQAAVEEFRNVVTELEKEINNYVESRSEDPVEETIVETPVEVVSEASAEPSAVSDVSEISVSDVKSSEISSDKVISDKKSEEERSPAFSNQYEDLGLVSDAASADISRIDSFSSARDASYDKILKMFLEAFEILSRMSDEEIEAVRKAKLEELSSLNADLGILCDAKVSDSLRAQSTVNLISVSAASDSASASDSDINENKANSGDGFIFELPSGNLKLQPKAGLGSVLCNLFSNNDGDEYPDLVQTLASLLGGMTNVGAFLLGKSFNTFNQIVKNINWEGIGNFARTTINNVYTDIMEGIHSIPDIINYGTTLWTDTIKPGINNIMTNYIRPAIEGGIGFWNNYVNPAIGYISSYLVNDFLPSAGQWFLDDLLPSVGQWLDENGQPIKQAFSDFLKNTVPEIMKGLGYAAVSIGTSALGTISTIVSFIKSDEFAGMINLGLDIGEYLMIGMFNRMQSRFNDMLYVGGQIADFLDKYGQNIPESIKDGINSFLYTYNKETKGYEVPPLLSGGPLLDDDLLTPGDIVEALILAGYKGGEAFLGTLLGDEPEEEDKEADEEDGEEDPDQPPMLPTDGSEEDDGGKDLIIPTISLPGGTLASPLLAEGPNIGVSYSDMTQMVAYALNPMPFDKDNIRKPTASLPTSGSGSSSSSLSLSLDAAICGATAGACLETMGISMSALSQNTNVNTLANTNSAASSSSSSTTTSFAPPTTTTTHAGTSTMPLIN